MAVLNVRFSNVQLARVDAKAADTDKKTVARQDKMYFEFMVVYG